MVKGDGATRGVGGVGRTMCKETRGMATRSTSKSVSWLGGGEELVRGKMSSSKTM
jgi:hypothetical protein